MSTLCRASTFEGTALSSNAPEWDFVGATIRLVNKRSARFTRRKLAAVVRKAIISYYNEQEKHEIMQAAKKLGQSVSSFVASAALMEARRTNRKP